MGSLARHLSRYLLVGLVGSLGVAAHADLTYEPVDFSEHYNSALDTTYAPDVPVGSVELGGIPFEIPVSGDNYWDGYYAGGGGDDVRSIEFPVGVQGVREVHTLINTQWGTAGGPFAWIDFYGSNGAYFRKDLFSCDDIRDHAPDNQWCGEINGTTTINVWDNGQSGSAHIVLDKQQIVLPSEFWNETLESISVTDAGLGVYHQRLMFVGVTAGVPEPTGLLLLAIGGVFAARRQR